MSLTLRWYLKVLRQYADFSGRARRKEYWIFILYNFIFFCITGILDYILEISLFGDYSYGFLSIIYSIGVLIPSLAVAVRRLHDMGKSGWWYFIQLIPLIGGIWLLVLLVTDTEIGNNQWGLNPKDEEFV